MAADEIRLGGMALANGVLVHGPTAWACAVRTQSGGVKVASGRKRRLPAQRPLLRGPARLAEALLVLPAVRRALPEARFAFERPSVLVLTALAAAVARVVRDSQRLSPAARELAAGLVALAPAMVALRGGDLAAYHGAEHISIGRHETGGPAAKEHERCGSHLVGPLIVTSALGAALAARAPERLRRPAGLVGTIASLAAATEIFGWMARNPEHPLARALARPGRELQRRIATAEPSPEQVEVAEAALRACMELEQPA